MRWPCWRNVYHAHDARGFDVDLVPRTAPIVRFVMVLLQAPNRRAGPLDMSGILCVWWTSTRVLDVSVSEVCVCVASSPGLLFSDTWNREPVTGALPLPPSNGRLQEPGRGPAASEDRQAPGTSCQARCFSISRSPLFPISSFVCCPGCRCAARGRYRLLHSSHLKPPKTLPIISYAFCLVPCAHFKCLTTANTTTLLLV